MEFKKALEGLKCISCGEYDLSILNLLNLSTKTANQNQLTNQQKSFFENLDDILVQNRIDTPTRWSFFCFLSRFGIFKGEEAIKASNFQIDSAIHEFEKISKKDRLLKNLKLFLFGQNVEIPNICSDKLALEFSREILYVASRYGSLYRTLQLLFKPLISEINDIRVFKLLGYSAFTLYPSAPPKEFWNIRLFTTNEQYRDVIYYSQDIPFLSKLQADYIDHFQYPNDFPGSLTFNSSSCSLLMTSIYKNVHFVDLLSQLIKEKIHKLEIGKIPEIARVAPSFIPILFAAYQPFLYLSPQIFLRLITAKLPSINNAENNFCYKNNNFSDNIIELQQRFINDLLFSKLVIDFNNESFSNNENEQTTKKPEKKKSFFSKKKKTDDTNNNNNVKVQPKVRRDSNLGLFIRDFSCPVNEILKGHSIPFLCNGYFRRPEFLEFESKKFYIFSDEEVQNDFDFIHIYNSITDTIELLQTTKERTKSMVLIQRSFLSSIDQNLSKIRDKNLLTKVAIDIFSLIFIKENKNENSNFLCQNLGIAYLIIKILKKFFNNDRFIKFGALLVSQKALSMPKNQILGISSVFKSNLNFLLNIIINKNWKEAKEIALLLSGNQKNNLDHRSQIYWRAFVLSNSVFNLISGKSCNVECEQFKEELNLEISVSSSIYNTDDCINYVLSIIEKNEKSEEEKEKKLNLINNINSIREKRKKIEVEDLFSPLRDSYWIDVEPAVVNLEMFPSEFFTNNLFERYEKPLKKSNLLFNFVNFFNIYFNCSNSDENNNVKKSFAFTPSQALSNAFSNGKIELADQMASKMNLNLFDFVMKNQKSFKLTPSVIEYFGSKYPLECIEIYHFLNKKQIHLDSEILTKSIKSNEKVDKIINYLNTENSIDDNNTLEEPIEFEFIELIKSTKQSENNENLFKEFDDYLYKISHSRISQIIISNFENINKDVALYLLGIVDYTIDTNSLNENIQKFLLKNEIEKFVSKEIKENDKIVERLIELNHFELASKFIKLCIQSQQEKDKIFIQIIQNFLNSKIDKETISNQICDFVSRFENSSYLYELIVSEIHDEISFISEICPSSIRPTLFAFSSLPESIRTTSSLFDKSTISKSICEKIRENKENEIVFLLNKENLILFKNEDLDSIVKELSDSCTNIDDFMKYSSHITTLTETSKEILKEQNSKRILKEMYSINIDSIESEFKAYLVIQKLTRFNKVCKLDDKTSSILKAYRLLLIESPFYFNHISYSIREEERNSNNLFDNLIKLDLDSVANLLPNELFDKFNYIKEKVEIMLKLGRFDDALHVLNVNKQYVYEMDELFLCPFIYKQFYHSNLLPKISNLCSNHEKFFTQIKTITNSESDLSKSLNSTLSNLLDYKEFVSHCKTKDPSSPFLSFCSDFCERFSSKDSFFRFCIRRGAMTTVVSKFMALDENDNFNYDINTTSQLFVNSIVECSIEYDKFQILKKELNDYSKYNTKSSVKNFWRYLVDFCEKHEMGYLLLESSEILALKDKIALSYIDIFGEIDSIEVSKKMKYLEKAITVLNELVNEGIQNQQPNNNSNKNEPNKNSKSRKIRSNSSSSSNSLEFNESKTDSSNSQQSSSILFDPDEFNSRSPDEFCEYDMTASLDEDDNKKVHKSKNAKKTKIHYGLFELLKIADLLHELLPLFIELNAPFPDSMNLFNGSVACLELGGFFLRNGKFELVQKISQVMKVPKKALVNTFFEFLTNGKLSNLSLCMKKNENKQNSDENSNKKDEENKNTNENLTENKNENSIENLDSNKGEIQDQNPTDGENSNKGEIQDQNSIDGENSNKGEIQAQNSIDGENADSNQKAEAAVEENADISKASISSDNSAFHSNLADNLNSNKAEIIQFVEDTKNEENFWKSDNFYNVHLYTEKLSISQNFNLIPVVLEKLLPEELEPSFLIEFDFLNQAFKILKEKNIETELIPVIAARASALGDYEMVKKCEEELGIKNDEKSLNEIDN